MIRAGLANPDHTAVIVPEGLPGAPLAAAVRQGDPAWAALQAAAPPG